MKLDKTLALAVLVSALSIAPLTADAQDRGGRERGGRRESAGAPAQRSNDGGRQATVREAPRQAAPQGRGQASRSEPRQSSPPPSVQPRSGGGRTAVPRQQETRQSGSSSPRQYGSQPPRQSEPRQYSGQTGQPAPRSYSRQAEPRRAVPRPSPSYRGSDRYSSNRYVYRPQPPRYYYARPYSGRVYVRPYSWVPYRPYYFARPYYSFRPWFSIGFGLSIGYPVPYPHAYLGTYRPRVYGYYDNYDSYGYDNSYGYSVAPDVSIYGGLSFDIQPSDADVWVDEEYVGTVGMFTPYGEPLSLTAGQHRILVQRDGFRAMEWDVMVEPGQVIPYRGAMERY